jgi:hypothetical protein
MASSQEQNKELVRQVFESYNQQDMEKTEKLFSPKHIFHFPGAPQPMDWNPHKQFIIGLSKAFQIFILESKILLQKVIKWLTVKLLVAHIKESFKGYRLPTRRYPSAPQTFQILWRVKWKKTG